MSPSRSASIALALILTAFDFEASRAAACSPQLFDVQSGAAGAGVTQVLAGDLNADGLADLVIVYGATGTIEIRRHVSATQFTTVSSWTWTSPIRRAVLADIDVDGKLDLAFTDAASHVVIDRGLGDGTMVLAKTISMPYPVFDLAAAEFGNGGALEIVVSHPAVGRVTTLMSGSGLNYSTSTTDISASVADPRWLAIGEFTGDQALDVVVSAGGSTQVVVLKGQGVFGVKAGTFVPGRILPTAGIPTSLKVSDLDRDGRADVIFGSDSHVEWEFGAGIVPLSSGGSQDVATGPVTDIAIGDLNGDGNQDILCTRQSSGLVTAILGAGSRTWGASTDYRLDGQPSSVALTDLGGLSGLDAIVATSVGLNWLVRNCDPLVDSRPSPDPTPHAIPADPTDPPIPPQIALAPPPLPPDPGPVPVESLWPTAGVVICDAPEAQSRLVGADDFAHGAYFAWIDARNGRNDIYATHLDASGAVVAGWPVNGLPVCTTLGDSTSLQIVTRDATGLWLTWLDSRDGVTAVYAQRLTPTGQVAAGWPAGGRRICDTPAETYRVFDDLQGGILIAWDFHTPASPNGSFENWYAQHLDANGQRHAGWPDCGFHTSYLSGGQRGCYYAGGNLVGMFSVWPDGLLLRIFSYYECSGSCYDCAPGTASTYDFGLAPYPLGVGYPALCSTGFTRQEGNGAIYSVDTCDKLTRSGGAYQPSWTLSGVSIYEPPEPDGLNRFSVLNSYPDWRLKVIENEGTWSPAFNATGVSVCSGPCAPVSALRTPDGEGGFFVAWIDQRPGAAGLYGTWLRSDGARAAGWASDGRLLAMVPVTADLAALVGDRRDNAIVAWRDQRNGNWDLFAQRLAGGATPLAAKKPQILPAALAPAPRANVLALSGARPNPSSDGLRVEFSLARPGDAAFRVLDVAGRVVVSRRLAGVAAGQHALMLARSTELPPGIYVIELAADAQVFRTKAVVTR